MADPKGTPIHAPTPATSAHTSAATDEGGQPLCDGCGASRHGSVGREVECLAAALRQERAQNARQRGELRALRAVVEGVREAMRAI